MFRSLMARLRRLGPLFLLVVCAPTALAVVYFGAIASDVYVSESRFIVRSPEKAAGNGLGMLFKATGFARAGDEIYAAHEFIGSRDALATLDRDGAFRRAYSGDAASLVDRFDPLGLDGSREALFRYYLGKVRVSHDTTSSITTLETRAFTAQDAERINRALLEQAEALVNRINDRGRRDLIAYAENEVAVAQRNAAQAATALAAYRNREGVVDPERQAAVQLQMISKLQDELIAARTQLAQLRQFTPRNPQVAVLQARIRELGTLIDAELGKVAGGSRSLASTVARYQRLQLESQTADKQLAAALASLAEARNEAQRKQAYIERVVEPSRPDDAQEPHRLRGILATLAVSLLVWGVLSMLLAGIREHGD